MDDLLVVIFLPSCSSMTCNFFNTTAGAKVYINDEYKGVTPYVYQDTKLAFSKIAIKLKKNGYKDFDTTISKNEEANVGTIIGGIFFMVPLL